VIIAFITPFYSPPCVRLCRNTDRSIVVFENLIFENTICLVIVFPNMVLAELASDLKLRVPNIDTNRTCVPDIDANGTSLTKPPKYFPRISHTLLQAVEDRHYRWDVPEHVDHWVDASDNEV
jgi:hypothetical protein